MIPPRIAVVTGANKGIGYFIALQLGLSGLFSDIILGNNDVVHIHCLPLTIGDPDSHTAFGATLERDFGGNVDVLVNNAGFAYKGSDPTPFEDQTAKTLQTNYYGLVDFTERVMIPLMLQNRMQKQMQKQNRMQKGGGTVPRIVNVASMAGRLGQVSPELQRRFTDPALTIEELNQLMGDFASSVKAGTHVSDGWSRSNYGVSKLGVIAATNVWARRLRETETETETQSSSSNSSSSNSSSIIVVNSCCPGYCDTDMTSHRGPRPPSEGARNAVLPATMENPPTGAFFANYAVAEW
eukprot:jgi/Psemu1/299628/fgenesh1_pm.2258_\